jgi:PPP family 3-phenylpropionic acid transporter
VFAPTLWGWIADRTLAFRAIVCLGCAANALCFLAVPFAPRFAPIAALVTLASFASAAALPLVEAITFSVLAGEPGRYGPIRLWGSIGFIAAVLAAGAWLDFERVTALPAALVAFSLASLAVAIVLPRGAPAHLPGAAAPFSLSREARALLAASFCMALAHGILYAFFTLHLQQHGYGSTLIGVLWSLGVIAEIGVFIYLPTLFRRYSLAAILMASCAIAIVRFAVIGWAAQWLWIIVLAQLMHAATFGAFHASAVAAVRRVFPHHAQARGQTLFSSVGYAAGGASGALLGGFAWDALGPGAAFSVGALAGTMGLLLAYPLKRAGL